MFKNREIRIKLAKTPQTENDPITMEERFNVDPEQIAQIAKDLLKHTVIAVGVVIVTKSVLTTLSQIIINKSESKDTE